MLLFLSPCFWVYGWMLLILPNSPPPLNPRQVGEEEMDYSDDEQEALARQTRARSKKGLTPLGTALPARARNVGDAIDAAGGGGGAAAAVTVAAGSLASGGGAGKSWDSCRGRGRGRGRGAPGAGRASVGGRGAGRGGMYARESGRGCYGQYGRGHGNQLEYMGPASCTGPGFGGISGSSFGPGFPSGGFGFGFGQVPTGMPPSSSLPFPPATYDSEPQQHFHHHHHHQQQYQQQQHQQQQQFYQQPPPLSGPPPPFMSGAAMAAIGVGAGAVPQQPWQEIGATTTLQPHYPQQQQQRPQYRYVPIQFAQPPPPPGKS